MTTNRRRLFTLLSLLLIPCNGFIRLGFHRPSLPPNKLPSKLGKALTNANPLVAPPEETNIFKEETPLLASTLSNYHLLWSPQVWKKTVLATLSLWIVLRTVNITNLQRFPQDSFLFNAVLPTLSSACCWIQMLLNMVSALGCAGFNTYLGPLRPYFLGLLAYLTLITRTETKPLVILARWSVALLPELLHCWNSALSTHRRNNNNTNKADGNNYSTTANGLTTDVAVYLDCPTMGCVACIQKVNASLEKALHATPLIQQIQAIDAWLLEGSRKGGKAKIRFSTPYHHHAKNSKRYDDDAQVDPKILETLVRILQKAGFPCTVDVVRSSVRRN